MAKEFKDFDKQFAEFAGKGIVLCGYQDSATLREVISKTCLVWNYRQEFTEAYTHEEIREVVYNDSGAIEWQRFRVSLKGLTTQEKLFCLSWWWNHNVVIYEGLFTYQGRKRVNEIRVNNYLGALKRGGQLNSQLEVVK